MRPENYKRIESLQNEVNEYHPILEQLFKRLPGVRQVEYHQGPNEKGADFVIIKYDDTLGEETYIGVVCKIGKITQSTPDVERQIDECKSIPRYISSGKKKVILNEIWIVNNSTISSNAEEKIFIKFSGTNIKFINGSKVTELIDKHYKEFWSFSSINYGQYFSDLELQLASGKDASLLGYIHDDKCIDQKIVKQLQRQNKSQHEKVLDVIKRESFIYLEGHVGSGKSTVIRQLVSALKKDIDSPGNSLIPVIFHYSEIMSLNKEIKDECIERLRKFHIPDDVNILIVIDGVDEVQESTENRLNKFESIIKQVSGQENYKLFVTSRIVDSLQDYKTIDRIFTRYAIVPLTIAQIINFVDRVCESDIVSRKLRVGIEKTPLFSFIPRTPISAILLARILKDEVKELPSTMAELYSKYTEIVLGRWDTSKGLLSQTEYEIINNVFMYLSKYMMDNSLSCISESEVEDVFLEYTEKRNIVVDLDKLYQRILKRSEIGTINPRNGTFSFVHRSFMEYFYAEKLKKDGNVTLDQEIYNIYWSNTYFFYLGLLRDSESSISIINSIIPDNDYYRFSRLFSNGRLYLAAYLTPYDKIKDGVFNTFHEAGRFYYEVTKTKGGGELRCFPPMALLCVITKCLQNNYAYDFFEKALRDAMLELDKVINPSDECQFSRFFISATLNEIGDKNAFDGLVEKNSLDILIQLGIQYVHEESGNVSKKIKHYFKKLKGQYAGNKRMENLIMDLHEKSIDDINNKIY